MRKFLIFSLSTLLMHSFAHATVDDYFNAIKQQPNTLYAFLKKMPKGGELHYHLAGSIYAETMLEYAKKKPFCMDVKHYTLALNKNCDTLTSKTLSEHPSIYENYIRDWTMKDFVPGKDSGHDHFFNSFIKFDPIMREFRPQFIAEVIKRAANQNELYLEIMDIPDNAKSTQFGNLISSTDDYSYNLRTLLDNEDFQQNIRYTIRQTKQMHQQSRKLLNCNKNPSSKQCRVTARYQYYILRNQPFEKVFAQAVNAFEVASKSPLTVGINIVQQEDGDYSLRDYTNHMKLIAFLHKKYPNVRIALHAGELSPTTVDTPRDMTFHINQAVNIAHANRIGHGVDIRYEDNTQQLIETMVKKQIAVEINLTSNSWILQTEGKSHPLKYYLTNNVPIVLSTDDEGILRTEITKEYTRAVVDHGLSYQQLKQAARNALTYNFLPGKSLWQDLQEEKPIAQCKDWELPSCQAFLNKSEKAALQLELEKQFKAFEKQYQ
jgi:adenosine deaminase